MFKNLVGTGPFNRTEVHPSEMMRRPNYAALIISVQGSCSGVVGATAMEAKMAKERTIPDQMRDCRQY
jgi:hypothetical protein